MAKIGNGKKASGAPKVNRKDQIVRSTESLLRERGIGGVTTRAIADAVPCSEGAIYVHFQDRLELILAVLQQSLPDMLVPLHALKESVGMNTPEKNLEAAVLGLLKFHDRVAPLLCSLVAEPELLGRFRRSLEGNDRGPHRGVASLARYIEQEQQGGRVATQLDAKTAALVLMSSSFFHIFTSQLLGFHAKLDVKRLVQFALRSTS